MATTPRMFDQMVDDSGAVPPDISPNRRICGEVIFEPLGSGIRVTGRTERHEVLWGMVCSKGMLEQRYCTVAVYGALQGEVEKALEAEGLPVTEQGDAITAAFAALDKMESLLAAVRKKITVKKVSPETRTRAAAIAKAVSDAYKMMMLEVPGAAVHGGAEDAKDGE